MKTFKRVETRAKITLTFWIMKVYIHWTSDNDTIKSILKKFISSCVYAVYFLFSYYKSILKAKKFSLVYSFKLLWLFKKVALYNPHPML